MKKQITIAAASILVIVAAMLVIFDPTTSVFAPKCFFKMATGWDCPGCGTQRALHALLHLELRTAWQCNPLLFFAIPYIILIIYLQYFGGGKRHPKLERFFMSGFSILIVFGLIVIYWVARNIF